MATVRQTLLNELRHGGPLQTNYAYANYGSAVRDHIRALRLEGHAIYTENERGDDGVRRTYYRLGRATKRYSALKKAGRLETAIRTLYQAD